LWAARRSSSVVAELLGGRDGPIRQSTSIRPKAGLKLNSKGPKAIGQDNVQQLDMAKAA
jgi:hypothetical protein